MQGAPTRSMVESDVDEMREREHRERNVQGEQNSEAWNAHMMRRSRSAHALMDQEDSRSHDVMFVELLKTVECAICLDIMFEPVVGICGHSFCERCIDSFSR